MTRYLKHIQYANIAKELFTNLFGYYIDHQNDKVYLLLPEYKPSVFTRGVVFQRVWNPTIEFCKEVMVTFAGGGGGGTAHQVGMHLVLRSFLCPAIRLSLLCFNIFVFIFFFVYSLRILIYWNVFTFFSVSQMIYSLILTT